MIEQATNLVLEHLRHIRGRVDGLTDDMRQVMLRLGAVERHLARMHISDVSQNSEIEQLRGREQRIERRLELTED
jgi:hypothetical protein